MIPLKSFSSALSFGGRDKNKNIAFIIWIAIALFAVIQGLITYRYNNYLIFENTFRNLIQQSSFYAPYPQYHFDANHYGPVFSVFFMPFALMPNAIGLMCWNLFNVIILFKAIGTIKLQKINLLYFIGIPCLIGSSLSDQSNAMVAAFIILSFTQLNKNKGIWSAMFIVLGTFIKLYGIVGLAFFFFVNDKKKFVIYLFMWAVVLFLLPMLFSSPAFILDSYKEWAASLIHKNINNELQNSQDISIMGFVRHIFYGYQMPNIAFLSVGIILFAIPYLNVKLYADERFKISILASALMFPVLFSTGSEDCTYIIAIIGAGLWYLITTEKVWKKFLLAVTILFSCNFHQFLFHAIALKYPILFNMLSLPFFVVWIILIRESFYLRIKKSYE